MVFIVIKLWKDVLLLMTLTAVLTFVKMYCIEEQHWGVSSHRCASFSLVGLCHSVNKFTLHYSHELNKLSSIVIKLVAQYLMSRKQCLYEGKTQAIESCKNRIHVLFMKCMQHFILSVSTLIFNVWSTVKEGQTQQLTVHDLHHFYFVTKNSLGQMKINEPERLKLKKQTS